PTSERSAAGADAPDSRKVRFTTRSREVDSCVTPPAGARADPSAMDVAAAVRDGDDQREDVVHAGALEIHPHEGLAVADGRALTLSVRELGLLVELARREGR